MRKNIILITITSFLFLFSCGVLPSTLKKAKEKGDALLESIANDNAISLFPKDEFPKESVELILKDLKENCHFNNKNGVFVNDFIQNNRGTKYVHLLYEFPLDCGNKRIMIMYLVGLRDLKLVGFGVESDQWNFDRQNGIGSRNNWEEFKTWIGSNMPGSPFWIIYGTVPPIEFRLTH